MQFFNQLCSVVRQNRPLIQRANLLTDALRQPVRAVSNRSQDEIVDNVLSSIPEKPKRPIGPYLRFVKLVKPKIVQENPNLNQREIVSKAAELWRNADKETLLRIQSEYFEDIERHKKSVQSYKASLSKEQNEALEELKSLQKREKKAKEIKKELQGLGKPKKSPNAFLLFCMSKEKPDLKQVKLKDWAKQLGKEFNDLPVEEKNVYIEKAKKLAEQYKQDKTQWEAKMKESGHENLLKPVVKKSTKKSKQPINKDSLSENLVSSAPKGKDDPQKKK